MTPSKNAILIRFGDNDFYYTWTEVLKSAVNDKGIFQLKDKKKLAFIFSQAAWGMYCLHQNRCEYGGLEDFSEKHINNIKNFLTIKEDRILLDDEVANYFTEEGYFGNGEDFYVYEYDCVVHSK